MRIDWLVFAFLAVWLAREYGLPLQAMRVICFVLLLLMLLVLLGVL